MLAEQNKRLEEAADHGRRLADATLAIAAERMRQAEDGRRFFDNRDAAIATLHAQGKSAAPDAVMRMVFEAGGGELAPPRPRLVKL